MSADEDERYFGRIAILRHFGVVRVDGVETGFALQAEDEDDRIHPSGELYTHTHKKNGIKN